MKKISSFLIALLMFSFVFTSCEEEGSSALSDEDVSDIAEATLGMGYMSNMIYGFYDLSDADTMEAMFDGLTITETSSSVTFDFSGVEMDVDEDGTADLTMTGSFTVAVSGDTLTITFSSLGATDSEISASISGTMTMTTSNYAVDITITGITSSAVTIIVDADVVDGIPSSINSATINGTDYTAEFQAALEDF